MDFPTYIDVIARSAPADWNVESGPTYLRVIEPGSDARHSTHTFVMAYRRNLSITMGYGMPCRAEVQTDFTRVFPNPQASLLNLRSR